MNFKAQIRRKGKAIFTLGAAVGLIVEMITEHKQRMQNNNQTESHLLGAEYRK